MRTFDFCLKFYHLTLFSPHPSPQPIYSLNRTDRGLFQSSHLFETRCFVKVVSIGLHRHDLHGSAISFELSFLALNDTERPVGNSTK